MSHLISFAGIAHLSSPWSIGRVALSFPVRPSCYGNIRPNLGFFNIYMHKSLVLTQFHLIPSSTKLYWPSITKYQPVPPHTYSVPPLTNQYRPILTQYHQEPNSTAFYWPSSTKYRPVSPRADPVTSNINQYHPLLTQYHQVPSNTASTKLYWPSTIKNQQSVLPYTDIVPSCFNQNRHNVLCCTPATF